MKKIPKEKLDSVLTMTRNYWKTGERDLIPARIALTQSLQIDVGVDWLCFLNIADSILQSNGFKRNASNATIYAVLNALGYEVVDDEIQES